MTVHLSREGISDEAILSIAKEVLSSEHPRLNFSGGELSEADEVREAIAKYSNLEYTFTYYEEDFFQTLRFHEKGKPLHSRIEILFIIKGTEEAERLYNEKANQEYEETYGKIEYDAAFGESYED